MATISAERPTQQVESLRFGKLAYTEEQVIAFHEGLLGFAQLRRMLHVSPEGWEPLEFLVPLEAPQLTFPILNPYLIRPSYELPDLSLADLARDESDGLLAYVITTFGATPEKSTVNLLAPVLINPKARRGRQVVLDGTEYRVDEPLLAKGPPPPKP